MNQSGVKLDEKEFEALLQRVAQAICFADRGANAEFDYEKTGYLAMARAAIREWIRGMNEMPAAAYPPGLFIKEEMDARGWTSADVAARMGGANAHDREVDQLTVDLIIHVHDDEDGCCIGEKTAQALARAFDVSAEYFLNLEASWMAFRAARKVSERGCRGMRKVMD